MALIYPALAQNNGSVWQLQCDLFPNVSSLKIACLGEDLHYVWNQNDQLYHRILGENKAWSEPEETVYHSPKNIGMWLQGVKIVLSPLGVLHVVSDSGDYCLFQPVSK